MPNRSNMQTIYLSNDEIEEELAKQASAPPPAPAFVEADINGQAVLLKVNALARYFVPRKDLQQLSATHLGEFENRMADRFEQALEYMDRELDDLEQTAAQRASTLEAMIQNAIVGCAHLQAQIHELHVENRKLKAAMRDLLDDIDG